MTHPPFNPAKTVNRGKSIHILNNAFALSGRILAADLYPGRCPGLFARWPYRPLIGRDIIRYVLESFTKGINSRPL